MAETKKPAKASTTKKTTSKKPAAKAVKPTKKAEAKTDKKAEPVKASRIASESPVIPRLYTVKVDTHLRVREGAGKDFDIIRLLDDGDVVSVYEQKDGFGRIGKDEWVMMSFLK